MERWEAAGIVENWKQLLGLGRRWLLDYLGPGFEEFGRTGAEVAN